MMKPDAKAILSIVILAAGALPEAPASGQAAAPYDHPLFTGPEHAPPVPGFDQQHLRLALRFDPARHRVLGDATLRIQPLDTALDTLLLFAAGLHIDSVFVREIDSASVAAAYRYGPGDALYVALHALPDPSAPFEVRLVYQARPRRGLYILRPDRDNPAQKRQIGTYGAPEANRHWFPSIDFPGDKMTSEMLVTADSSLRVLSNGQVLDIRAVAGGQVTTHYAQDRPHAPQSVMLAAGEYEVMRERVRTAAGAEPVSLSYWIYPERIGDVARTFGRTPEMMRFFSEKLDYVYPWAEYAQVVLRQPHAAGIGNTGITSVTDRILIDARAALDADPDGLLARALARQWFGSLVTAHYWTDVWLNEGFPTYLGALFLEAHQGNDAFSTTLLGLADAYLAQAGVYRRPLVWNRWVHPMQMFDAHSAQKGAWVLHMLRKRLGDETFWTVLNRYLNDYAFKPVETNDFKRALEAVTREDFDAFFEQWIYAAGHPVLDVSYAFDDDERALTFRVDQRQAGYRVPDVFQLDLTVAVHTLTEAFRFQLPIDGRTQTFTFPFSSFPRFVTVDPDQEILAETRVDQPERAWVAQLRDAPDAAGRMRAARALAAFRDDPALLIGLRNALAEEPAAPVRASIVETMRVMPPSAALERALRDAFKDESAAVRTAILDALGHYPGAPAVRDLAFQAAQNDRSYTVQAAAVKTLARINSPDALDVIRSALVTPSHRDVIRQAAFEALAVLGVPAREGLDLALPYTAAEQPSEVRGAAIGYLQTLARDARSALDRLLALLEDEDLSVRQAAIDALRAVGTPRARQALARRRPSEPEPLLQAAIERALRQAASE